MICITMMLLLSGCQASISESEATGLDDTEKEKAVTEVAAPMQTEDVQGDVSLVPQSGGTMYLTMRNVHTLNPLLNEDETVDKILKLIYMPLVQLDVQKKPVPCIAESWQFSEDGLTLDVQLRSDIYWQDGSNLTADDVIFSLNTIASADVDSMYKGIMGYISGYGKTGEHSVSITFYSAYSANIYALFFPVISGNYYKGENMADISSGKHMLPMGNGFYQYVKFSPAKELRLQKCGSSFGTIPYIDEIVVNISVDKDTDFYSFDQGIIDALAVDVSDMGKYDSSKNTTLYEYTTNYYDFVGFNFTRSIFQDKNMRKAVAHALPKEALLESAYLSHATLTDTLVNPNYWYYEDDVEKYEYDLRKAEQLLEESNWMDTSGNGIRDRRTNELTETLKTSILVNEENESRRQIALRLADELRGIGFDVTVDIQPYDIYVQKLENKDFDMFVGGWNFSVMPDYSFILQSSRIGQENYIGYNSADMDALLAAAHNAFREEDVKAAYSNLQKKFAEELPYISIAYRSSALFSANRLKGDVKPLESNVYYNVNQWFIYEPKGKNGTGSENNVPASTE